MADSTPAISGPSRGPSVLIVTTTTFALTTLFVLGRLISRFAIVRNHTWDDWFIILAWFFAFGLSFAIDWGTTRGLGSRDVDIKPEWEHSLRSAQYAFTILYNPALMATKTSILIFYIRMSRNTQKLLRIASYATLALVNVSGFVLIFLNAFRCSPPSSAYEVNKDTGSCINLITLYLCSSPVNIFCNLAILVLPIPVLTGMRLPQRQKTVLVFTFALGIFVTIVDVVRIYYLQRAVDNEVRSTDRFTVLKDFSWNSSLALMWTAVEVNVGIICACIPTLKPLMKKIMPSILKERSRTNSATEKTSLSSETTPESHVAPDSLAAEIAPQPLPAVHVGPMAHDQENQMGMMDFLTTPERGIINRTATAGTAATTATENTVYFGFVNMRKPKSMLKIRGKESFKYCTIVTILFFLWGFSYGLLNTLNNQISAIAGQSTAQNLGLTTAYFGTYFFGAMTVGQWVLRHAGFKATFIVGLCFYGTGTLMFWPSAVLTSFPGFILSNFVVAFGLSILETAANPFLALCGPSQHSEYRLLLAQGVQAIGSILSSLLAQKLLFRDVVARAEASLIDIQWTYLGVAFFDVMLALFFYYMPLPEATDLELERQSEDQGIYHSQTVFSPKLPLIYVTLGLAVLAQFCYVAAQESTSVWISPLLTSRGADTLTLTTTNYGLVGHTLFALSRFMFGFLSLVVAPRILLLIALVGCLIFCILTTFVESASGNGIAAFVLMILFFEGPIWPLIFAIGLRGLGRRTKMGAAMITAAASGGGIFPFVMWAVQKLQHKTVQFSYVVNVALLALGCLFPLYLNSVPQARRQVDPKGNALGLPTDELDDSSVSGGIGGGMHTPIRRMSRRFSVMFAKIGGGVKSDLEEPVFEHRESKSRGPDESASGDESRISPPADRPRASGGNGIGISAEDRIWSSWESDATPKKKDVGRLRGE